MMVGLTDLIIKYNAEICTRYPPVITTIISSSMIADILTSEGRRGEEEG